MLWNGLFSVKCVQIYFAYAAFSTVDYLDGLYWTKARIKMNESATRNAYMYFVVYVNSIMSLERNKDF